MGGRWLSKHSVHGKKSPLVKGDLIDRLTGQNNGFELGGNRDKILVSGNVKCLRLEPQDNKTRLSYVMLGDFLQLPFFFFFKVMFTILQILTSAKEITLVT